jgi:hypothetical protein
MKYTRYNKIVFFFALAAMACLAACKKDFLDAKGNAIIIEADVFKDSARALGVVNQLYNNLGISYNQRRFSNQGLDAACDESEPVSDLTAYTYRITTGGVNPSNADKGLWTTAYSMIRAANVFMKNKDSIPVIDSVRNEWTAEVRFMRAWYYFQLVKHYGGVPLIGDRIFKEDEKIDIKRSTYEACVNYIVAECDAATGPLPLSYQPSNLSWMKVTKGAAMAVKARMLLYAASDLVNNGARADDPEHLVSYATADPERWRLAAKAAKDVILLGQYSLYKATATPLYSFFLQNTPQAEHILNYWLPVSTANNFYVENVSNPQSRSTSNSYAGAKAFPIQELVDEFEMSNGLKITDAASGYPGIGDNMYKNRDPRFYATISYNGSIRNMGGLGDQPVNTYTGVIPTGNAAATSAISDGIYTSTGTKTGYFRYKTLYNFGVAGGSELGRPWWLIRYAEILLNAAEATNESEGATQEVYNWLIDIRSRAGIAAGSNGLYGLKPNMLKDEMREVVRHERRVELAFEEHRFWDIRRWKIAPTVENAETHGMEITRAANGSFSYRVVVLRKHVFTDAMYFWPIPQSELTTTASLKQNPGY